MKKFFSLFAKTISFTKRNYSLILVILGFLGFGLAFCYLLSPFQKNKTFLTEVHFEKRIIATELLDLQLQGIAQKIEESKSPYWQNQKIYMLRQKDSVNAYDEKQLSAWFDKNIYVANFDPTTPFKINTTFWVSLQYKTDSSFGICKAYPFTLQSVNNNLEFILKNPAIGIWMVLVFAMVSSWFMLFLAVPGSMRVLYNKVTRLDGVKLNKKRIFFSILVAEAIVLIFGFLLNRTFNIVGDIPGKLFEEKFKTFNQFLFLVGYLAAGLCLAEFLFSAYLMFEIFTSNKFTPGNEKFTSKYLLVKKQLNNALLISAILLSFFIFSSGTLFIGINNLDYIRLLHKDHSLPYLSIDGIFLFAAIHTLLLLIFYIPVKITSLQIENDYLENTETMVGITATKSPEPKKVIKNAFEKFLDLLVPTSPLIAGLIQLLINYFFN